MAAEAERTTELDRFIFFSDGVFAIAITLLVIGPRVPALPSHVANSELSRRLLDEWPRVLSYALGFAVIGLHWIGRHRFFGNIRRFSTVLWLYAWQAKLPDVGQLSRLSFLVVRRIVDIR